ncbi:hypothetical protein AB6A40_004544 [Gnathostoma spinigerum]|uniref:Uncharacterized protein n=1 Tax=Gnathostoma spinigerum TaxID=75299 RepID=A0ABD6ENI3_9BILA
MSLYFISLLSLILLDSSEETVIGRVQSITVNGTLMCGFKTIVGAEVELYDHDRFSRDDLLGSAVTDVFGRFSVSGEKRQMSYIEPYLWITHNCDNGYIDKSCTLQGKYVIPNAKAFIGGTFTANIINLNQPVLRDQKKKCKS